MEELHCEIYSVKVQPGMSLQFGDEWKGQELILVPAEVWEWIINKSCLRFDDVQRMEAKND